MLVFLYIAFVLLRFFFCFVNICVSLPHRERKPAPAQTPQTSLTAQVQVRRDALYIFTFVIQINMLVNNNKAMWVTRQVCREMFFINYLEIRTNSGKPSLRWRSTDAHKHMPTRQIAVRLTGLKGSWGYLLTSNLDFSVMSEKSPSDHMIWPLLRSISPSIQSKRFLPSTLLAVSQPISPFSWSLHYTAALQSPGVIQCVKWVLIVLMVLSVSECTFNGHLIVE